MRAVGFTEFGGPEVLKVVDLPEPQPGPGEVRIRVRAAAVNPADIGYRLGGRVAALAAQAGAQPPYVPGMELAGTVDGVGEKTGFQQGERVMAIVYPFRPGGGAQAELVVVPAESVARVPEGTTLEQAATLPMNGLTVRLALDKLALRRGQTLAVTGAAGAIGAYAVQLGASEGLRVIAVASPKDESLARQLGAQMFVPRGNDFVQDIRRLVPDGVDGMVDGAVLGAAALGAIRDGGRLANMRGQSGPSERGVSIMPVLVAEYLKNQAALEGLARLVAEDKLTLRVAEHFPPERAAQAQQLLAAGGTRGRLLIVF